MLYWPTNLVVNQLELIPTCSKNIKVYVDAGSLRRLWMSTTTIRSFSIENRRNTARRCELSSQYAYTVVKREDSVQMLSLRAN